jgi:hypothetical protein
MLGTNTETVVVPGNMGIGTTKPLCPLYVNGYTTSSQQTNGYYINNSSSSGAASIITTTPYNYSIYASNSIATSDKLIATTTITFSDERIKTNIEDLDNKKALETLRQIKPKKYNYVDNISQGREPVWGFVAQQIKSVLNYSVTTSTNFIPNIYELADVIDGNRLWLRTKETFDISLNNSETKIKLISSQNKEIIVTIDKIIHEKIILIKEKLDVNEIFVYGQEVHDFNNLDKDAIFTITTAALQEVDKELQNTKKIVNTQENKIQSLENKINELQIQMDMIINNIYRV